jgi:hypothetical protein
VARDDERDLLLVRGRERGREAARFDRRFIRAPLVAEIVRRLALEALEQETRTNRWLEQIAKAAGPEPFVQAYKDAYLEEWR